jgi:hypothetical protein
LERARAENEAGGTDTEPRRIALTHTDRGTRPGRCCGGVGRFKPTSLMTSGIVQTACPTLLGLVIAVEQLR